MMGLWLLVLTGPRGGTFTAEFKAAILAEYDAADRSGRGEILRREGLYTSHIIEWRKAAAAGSLSGLGSKPRDRRERELQALRARAEKAEAELAKTRAALDLMGKSTRALGDALRERGQAAAVAAVINPAVDGLAEHVGTAAACALLGRSAPVTTGPRTRHRHVHGHRGRHRRTSCPPPSGPTCWPC
ncbi:hypothetical protein AB1285_23260 [Microbacterium sp. NRRL B-14842]